MSTETSRAGRKPPNSYTNHFECLDKKDDKSNRYNWCCKYCGDEDNSPGASIEGRDNNLPNHLADTRKCRNAPASARLDALRFMADKKKGCGQSTATDDDNLDVVGGDAAASWDIEDLMEN
ncbi:hypothetical protein B0H13DRAFT_1893954 [Mycena leptocephala]|nr:hypothetical protein B0H13DRAFT_1893954 [Mycena leptocephala]